eukprot:TRINITY_DN18789_c0_g1_i1.p1 TRINITY_DN18789_c0_g1~~TRINITY_DN18789_c0_g1_i1.p1  ORF type:complete len:460 (-),score=53.22 TRINITY_DN18789_c0_g1_i1:89-1468(-)
MALERAACFNVPGIFSPHRLTIRYPPPEIEGAQEDAGLAQVGEKRKQPEALFLEEEIALNALELATESEVFEKLFTSELQGSEHPSVTVDSILEKDALFELLRFCYTKSVPDASSSDKDALIRLLILADRYSVVRGIQPIAKALQEDAKLGDACRVLDLPGSIREQGSMEDLVAFSEELIKSEMLDLDDAYKKRKYEGLSAEGLRLALANEASRVACEHTVFVMVYKWLKGAEGRERAFPDLSRLIRYQHMTSSFLSLIQQLPEMQHAEVALSITRALVLRGLQGHAIVVQSRDNEGKLRHQGVLPPRPGAVTPFTETFEVALEKAKICSLKHPVTYPIDEREVFGYKLECEFGRISAGLALVTKLTTPFLLSGPERNTSPTNGVELTPLFTKLRIVHQGQDFTGVCDLPITQQIDVGGDWFNIVGAIKLRVNSQESKELLAENFVEQKLKLRISITLA